MRTVIFWFITQLVMVISYRLFGTTYTSIFKDLNYHYLLRKNPAERSPHAINLNTYVSLYFTIHDFTLQLRQTAL